MTTKYSGPNWDLRKSPDNREIRIIEVRLYCELNYLKIKNKDAVMF